MSQELDHFFFSDRLVEDLEIEIPQCHPGGDGNGLPVEVILQYRRLAARSPGAAAMRAVAQSAFVNEDERATFRLGFFLMTGQRSVFHC